MNYFEMYGGDYLRDTSRLNLTDHGAYLRLMIAYYGEEQPLPASHDDLYQICAAISASDKAAVRKVADKYFPVASDGLRHKNRIDEEIAKARKRIEIARANGGKGGRKNKPGENPAGIPAGSLGDTPEGTQRVPHPGEAPHTPHATINTTGTDVPDAGASDDTKPADPIWGTGLAYLMRCGLEEKQARSILGKLKQSAGDITAAALLADAEALSISDPIPWLSVGARNAAAKKAKPSATDDFRGKTYAGTADDDLPESLR